MPEDAETSRVTRVNQSTPGGTTPLANYAYYTVCTILVGKDVSQPSRAAVITACAGMTRGLRGNDKRPGNDPHRSGQIYLPTCLVWMAYYNGLGQLVGTAYPEPDVKYLAYDPANTDSFRDLDRFNRVTTSRWFKDLGTDKDFYNVDITYDRNSNITLIEDNVHSGFDVDYTNDNLGRLLKLTDFRLRGVFSGD